jgi:hypothetical protein
MVRTFLKVYIELGSSFVSARTSYGGVGPVRGLRGEEGGGVRSGPGEARTILLLHIISVRPSKQPLMVRTFLKV